MTSLGYLIFFAGVGVYLLWYGLYRTRAIPAHVAVGLVLLTFLLGAWLLPMLTPMKLRRE